MNRTERFDQKKKYFFESFAKKYKDADFLNKPPGDALEFQTFLKFLDLPPGSFLIDLGCGSGRYAIPLLKLGYKITGVDIAKEALRILTKNAQKIGLKKNLKILENDFYQTVFENVFDGAYCISTFHLLSDKEKVRIEILKNLVRAVKKGGKVVVLEPNPLNPFFYPYYWFSPEAEWKIEKHFVKSTIGNLRKIFSEVGLTNIQVKRYGFLPARLINYLPFVLKINFFIAKNRFLGNFAAFNFIKGIKANETS